MSVPFHPVPEPEPAPASIGPARWNKGNYSLETSGWFVHRSISTICVFNTYYQIMATNDSACSIVPYFKIAAGKLDQFKTLCEQFVAKTQGESKVLHYGFSFDGDVAHCRECYADAEGVLQHLDNVGAILGEALKISEIIQLEIHGPEAELARLRGPLAELNPKFFVLEYGFRR